MAELKLTPSLGQRPDLIIQPGLIQSLKLLMEPILNLEMIIRQRLSDNPLLEEVDQQDTPEEIAATTPEPEPERKEEKTIDKIDWEEFLGEGHEYNDGGYRDFSINSDDDYPESITAAEISLSDHLMEQLGYAKLDEKQKDIGAYIIGNINDAGFLAVSVEDIAAELKVEQKTVEDVLRAVKTFDPTGIGSKDLRECLLAQLDEQGLKGSLAWIVVDEHIKELENKSVIQLAKILGTTPEKVDQALKAIRSLSPRPATGRFTKAATPIVPDLIVDKIGDEIIVYHNDKNLPQLRINQAYKSLIKRGSNSTEPTKQYIKDKLEQARWLINAINQRRSTMINVMNAVVEEQREFFEHGESHLKPLTMEQIADKVGMNVATISRVASGKYTQTPLGMYEIKYFFNTGVTTDSGEDLPKRVVKGKIEDIIKAENPATPYSDQEIGKLLSRQGIQLARRTVTKYREELGIKAARYRKEVPRTS
jgi:RNA polymerase sigma-54 factor